MGNAFALLADRLVDAAQHKLWLGTTAAPRGTVLYYNASTAAASESTASGTRMRIHTSTLLAPRIVRAADLPASTCADASTSAVLRLVCISDTHDCHGCVDVPNGDVLLVAGDMLARGRAFSHTYATKKLQHVADWLNAHPHPHKVVIGGNHDLPMETLGAEAVQRLFSSSSGVCGAAAQHNGRDRGPVGSTIYLEDSGTTLTFPVHAGAGAGRTAGKVARAVSVYGTPHNRGSSRNSAFQTRASERLAAIPAGVDVLLSHGPLPSDVLARARPRVHVWGHLHERYGVRVRGDGCVCVNASIMDAQYNPSNRPVVVDIDLDAGAGAGAGAVGASSTKRWKVSSV